MMDLGSLSRGAGIVGVGLGLLEGYALYRVWKSGPTSKTWPWYVLGVGVTFDVLGRFVTGAALIAAPSVAAAVAPDDTTLLPRTAGVDTTLLSRTAGLPAGY